MCGVAVCCEDTKPETSDQIGVNLRCFEGVEWDQLKVVKGYWSKVDPQYVVPE